MIVREILKDKPELGVLWVKPSARVTEAAAIMAEKRVGTVVVSPDGETLTGIVSERDIVRELGRRGGDVLTEPVENLMTKRIVTCSESDDAVAILQTMTDGRFRHLPVMEGERMIGLISIGDVVKGRLRELAMERDALEGMIMGN